MRKIDIFKSYICGDFDNQEQVAEEVRVGHQIHPLAKHVTRVADAKIQNLPPQYNGVFVLEESYYTYPDKPTEVKPYLFWFEETALGNVRLHSIALPTDIDKADIRNDNPHLTFDFKDLKDSSTFTPAEYTHTERGFYIKNVIELPNNMSFTLEETIGDGFLEVMESLKKGDVLLTPYSTPIQYKRI